MFFVHLYHILFIPSPADKYLDCSHLLAIANNGVMNMDTQISLLSLLGEIHPEAELLNNMIILCLIS